MAGRALQRLRAASLILGVLAVAAGCGGGGTGVSGDSPGAMTPAPTSPSSPVAGQISAVAWATPSVRVEHDAFATSAPAAVTASLTMQAPGVGYWFRYSHDQSLATLGYTFRTADDGIDFSIVFTAFPARALGSYTDTLSVTVCYDENCTREVPGSPFTLPLRLDLGYFARAEEGVTQLVPAQTTVLRHDVLGAAYSAALDAVITVSARPEPMLRVHDLRSGLTRSVPLQTAPTSLSVGADGLRAAVGHDAAVSLVDLSAGAETAVRRMAVPMPVGSVVLAGARIVAVGAQASNWNSVYWVDTLTGAATQTGSTIIYGLADLVLHPDGGRIYMADRGLSPDDVRRLDLGGDPATAQAHDTRYHGEYPFCGRLAVSPDGRFLYTGCGAVLSTALLLADDMLYAGKMPLSQPDARTFDPYRAIALSVAPDNASVALLEEKRDACVSRSEQLFECHTRVAVHDATTLARRSLHGLPPFELGSDRLRQWGRRVMHRADGSLIVIAEVRTRDEPIPTWLLHRLSQ